MNYYNKKRKHTTTKQIPSIVFTEVKDEKLFGLVKIETEKIRKRLYEDRPFKEGDIVRCSSRIEETECRKNLYQLIPKGKKFKGTKYERHIIVCKVLKVKMQYCLLEVTEAVLESKIFKIGDTFRATYDWLILFGS